MRKSPNLLLITLFCCEFFQSAYWMSKSRAISPLPGNSPFSIYLISAWLAEVLCVLFYFYFFSHFCQCLRMFTNRSRYFHSAAMLHAKHVIEKLSLKHARTEVSLTSWLGFSIAPFSNSNGAASAAFLSSIMESNFLRVRHVLLTVRNVFCFVDQAGTLWAHHKMAAVSSMIGI